MKKRISLLLLALVCILSFAGCTSNKESIQYDAASLETTADTVINSFTQMSDENFEQFLEGTDLQVDLTLMQSGLPVKGDDFRTMIESWQAAKEDCGTYEGHGDFEVEESSQEITLTTEAQYDKKEATITFVFDKDLNMESMTVDANYSTGEILEKAGLNTILGMGTVFVVLIFISFIISLFKYIPALEAKLTGKGKKTSEIPAVIPAKDVAETTDVSNDLELAAVISAAIAASEGTSTDSFVVRSVKRRTSNKWN